MMDPAAETAAAETAAAETAPQTPAPESPHGEEEAPSAEELRTKLETLTREARKWEDRAKGNYERAQQAETLEKELADVRAALDQQKAEAELKVTRYRLAVEHGLSLEDADLLLTGADEDTMRAQAARLVAARGTVGPNPGQGRHVEPAKNPADLFFDTLNKL